MKGSRVQISVSARNQEVASQDATSFSYAAGGAPAACRKTTAGHRGAPYRASRPATPASEPRPQGSAGTPATCFASPSRFRRASPQRHCIPVSTSIYLKEFDCQAVVSHEEEDPDRRSETEIPVQGLKAGRSAVQTPQGGSRAREIPATGGRRHIVVWQTTNPLISKKSGPRVAGIQAVSGEGLPHGGPCRSAGKPAAPAPTGSCRPHVSRNTVCGGSKRMRTLPFIRSAANGDLTGRRKEMISPF